MASYNVASSIDMCQVPGALPWYSGGAAPRRQHAHTAAAGATHPVTRRAAPAAALAPGVVLQNLFERRVTSLEQVRQLLSSGGARKQVASTKMNEQSSRSHTIVRLAIESRQGPA